MLQSVDDSQRSRLEYIYDQYSPLLYGVILKILADESEAEAILIKSFNLFFSKKITADNNKLIFFHLLNVAILVTAEHVSIPKVEIGKMILKDLQT